MSVAPDATPIAPVYPFAEPGDDLELYAGPATIDGDQIGKARIRLTTSGDLRIRWTADDVPSLGPTALTIDHPHYGPTPLNAYVTGTAGRGNIEVSALGGSDAAVTRTVVHWVNLPFLLPAAGLASGGANWLGRWVCRTAQWQLVVDARRDLPGRENDFAESHAFAFTHTAAITRVDDAAYAPSDMQELLYAWQTGFSFAFGRWVAPALPVGFAGDRRAWEQWAPWRCDAAIPNYHWCDAYAADDLRDFTSRFIDAWFGADHEVVRHVAHHIISANHSTTTLEARLMLVQAAIEYLAWTDFVLSGRMTKRAYKALDADAHMRMLLDDAGIPAALPAELTALPALPLDGARDGPRAITWMRNRLVHPKDAGEPYRIEHALREAWQLAMHYAELLLLHRLGYQGRYLRRFPLGRWAHDTDPVPWASPAL